MAEIPLTLAAVTYDDVTNRLTLTLAADHPAPPETVRPDLWYPQARGGFSVTLPVGRERFRDPTAIWLDPDTMTRYRVTWTGGAWVMPGEPVTDEPLSVAEPGPVRGTPTVVRA